MNIKSKTAKISLIVFLIIISIIVLPVLVLYGIYLVNYYTDENRKIVLGLPEYSDMDYYSHGVIQDFTDYGKYYYEDITEAELTATGKFKQITAQNRQNLLKYIEDYEMWVEFSDDNHGLFMGDNLTEKYDFDIDMLKVGGWYYLEPQAEMNKVETNTDIQYYNGDFSTYNIYYFDIDNQTLYYMHNNT